ncbi:M1 family metallopeptidase [Paenibacillus thermoaerophilus]|uniref:M1 family metallopeptidase n=1 Tax=Paenibacillus thermoaerophilus TaxID=1215385 RepID=A0ABW2V395_9BACL|nr:M1 family metallopeptidase [Paenibacillus thermoaerophilus]
MIRTIAKPYRLLLLLGLALAVTLIWTALNLRSGRDADTFALSGPGQPNAGQAPAPAVPKPQPTPKEPPLSERVAEYHIGVALDESDKSLTGAETLTWRNPGKKPVTELYFHLYPNAFASGKSTFMRESGGKLRGDKMPAGGYGQMEITSLKTSSGVDLTPHMHFVQPDDGNKDDKTLMRIVLPEPIPPGGKTTLQIAFRVKLPQAFARMGYSGDFVMAGQWFPKIAVYEPAGTRGRPDEGWSLHQYHGNSEFYSDFAIYSVNIKVPSRYIVASTGFQTKTATDDGRTKTYHFYADDVHDFAWAASPDFVYAEEKFSTPNIPGMRIKLYLDPAHRHLKDRYMAAAKKSLARYSEWFGTYPYQTLSIVVPPAGANGAGGMEYPTLVTAWGAGDPNPGFELERVVVHEIGHQYWYGMVASNEFEEAWLDEGFTSYAEDLVMETDYGVKSNLAMESSFITSPASLNRFAWNFKSHSHYADNVYTRAKLILVDIEKQIGRDTMRKVLRTYFQKWKFRHPTSREFQATLESVTKQNWQPYFDQYVYGDRMVDFSVDSIRSKKLPGDAEARGAETLYEHEVLIRNKGGTHSAVPIAFRFGDGTEQRQIWDGQGESIVYKFTYNSPLLNVQVDPDKTMVLENRHINNFMRTDVDRRQSVRWSLGLDKLAEALIRALAW